MKGTIWKTLGDVCMEGLFPSGLYCLCCGRVMDPRFPYGICGSCMELLHWVTGTQCGKCGKPMQEKGLLPGMQRKPLCEDCQEDGRTFDRGAVCVWYGLLERELMHRFKYGGQSWMGAPLGRLLAEKLKMERMKPDVVVPAPMFSGKEIRRGYNQAELLARSVAWELGVPCLTGALFRERETAAMSGLSAGERRNNLREALRLNREKVENWKGKTILIADDVLTTGTTADACAELLKDAGAARVWVGTFAATAGRWK